MRERSTRGPRASLIPIAALFAATLFGLATSARASAPCGTGPTDDIVAVGRVVDAFGKAIVARDKRAYMDLFFSERPEEIGWQAVVDDARLRNIRADRPAAVKARHIPANHFVSLIDGIVAGATADEERISDLCVHTDGEIASAIFEYVYLSDGTASHRGSEHWQLVRTEGGWKIFSVVYTIRSP